MNQHIFLAPEAVFPIVYDENGERLAQKPATDFPVPGTIQGEGKMAGIPVLFLRTAGCNLRCMWSLPNGEVSLCDTPHASFNTNFEKKVDVEKVGNLILKNMESLNHLVISGGEPFIQIEPLIALIKYLKVHKPIYISVETNGTIFNEELVGLIDFFSISPKLKNSVPTLKKLSKTKAVIPFEPQHAEGLRRNIEVLQKLIDHATTNSGKDFQLKFVVQSHDELEEIEESFLQELRNWKPNDVVLMPVGSSRDELNQTRMVALEAAIERGWRFSPRLQVTYFGGKVGV